MQMQSRDYSSSQEGHRGQSASAVFNEAVPKAAGGFIAVLPGAVRSLVRHSPSENAQRNAGSFLQPALNMVLSSAIKYAEKRKKKCQSNLMVYGTEIL